MGALTAAVNLFVEGVKHFYAYYVVTSKGNKLLLTYFCRGPMSKKLLHIPKQIM